VNIRFRPACKEDAATITRFYRISSEGFTDYVLTTLAEPGEDILATGTRRYSDRDNIFAYPSCTIVEVDGEIAGMMSAFPVHSRGHEPSAAEPDPVLAPISNLEEKDSYYICGVALRAEHRGNGIGTRFMGLAERKAKALGLEKISLIVFEQNEGAKRLYERLGYRESAREKIIPHPLIHVTGEAVLMVKRLDQKPVQPTV